ncbi:MAG: right-handed parallel beta-helix repeat-containing protein [Chloroflexi bacterium]|nr:right-handed parallel beta-helix repeat-containing protein [Chloroflexota bacterium]
MLVLALGLGTTGFVSALPQGGRARLTTAALPTVELYGTFHSMGVIVTLAAVDDPNQDATAGLEYRTGTEPYQAGFPLSRISATQFVGSLFWLEPGTTYDVRVTLSDPDAGPLNGVFLIQAATTRAELVIPAPSRSVYVAPAGSGGTCSQVSPCALGEALSRVQPGDAVFLTGGVYYQGEFTLPRSGTPSAPVVILSNPGETAILDGADPAKFTWAARGDRVYHTVVNAPDPHVVLAGGSRLFPYESLADLQLLRWGVPGFYASGTDLYVRLANDADPNATAMTVSRFNNAFVVEQQFIYFVGLTFRHYGRGSHAKAIYLSDASDNVVQGSTFASNDLGIGMKYQSHRNVIQDNVFSDTIFGWPWDAVKAVDGLEDGGVYAYEPMSGRGNVIRRNVFHDDFDGLHVCPWTGETTNETDVYENVVYRMIDDGIETDGRCSNVRIWRNTLHDSLMGISLAPVYTGPVYALRNVIYRTGVGDRYGSAFKFNSGYDQSGTMYLFHNTVDAARPNQNALTIFEPGTWRLIHARNNIWHGTAYAIENYNTGQPVSLDYDDLSTSGGGDLARWSNTRYPTLAAFTAATGQESHGLSTPPGFVDPGNGNYRLDPASSLVDAGVVIPGINDRGPHVYQGRAPDIGAYEESADQREAGTKIELPPRPAGSSPATKSEIVDTSNTAARSLPRGPFIPTSGAINRLLGDARLPSHWLTEERDPRSERVRV